MSYMRKTEEVPAYHEMMQELFQAIKELGGSGTIQEIDDKTIEILGLSPEVLTVFDKGIIINHNKNRANLH